MFQPLVFFITPNNVIRKGDTLARFGGDEFVIIIEDGHDMTLFGNIAYKIQQVLNEPIIIEQHELMTSCSIGISIFPQDGESSETLLSNADAAMYVSKKNGRHQFQFYTPDMTQKAYEYLKLESELKGAIDKNELLLYFQPFIDIDSGEYLKIEALIRWNHHQLGIISPGIFLPIAKKAGLMKEVDYWVTKHAIAVLKKLHHSKSISINITAETLFDTNFVPTLEQYIRECNVDPKRVVLEILENQLIEDMDKAKDIIGRLHKIGVLIALDDFGVGYSSLSYILELEIDILKIDQSFIRRINHDEKGRLIVKSIVSLAEILGLNTIAEGVETEEEYQFLHDAGLGMLQGYLFAKPMDETDLLTSFKVSKEKY